MSSVALNNKRKARVRNKIRRSAKEKVRLMVFRSNQHIYVQLFDESAGKIVGSASTLDKDLNSLKSKSNIEAAKKVGALIAKRAKDMKISEVVFDRGGYIYHGRVKALAEAARAGGLKF